MKKILSILWVLVVMASASHATQLAIKLNLSQHAINLVDQIIDAGKLKSAADAQKIVKMPHITIGFVSGLKDINEATMLGSIAKTFLDQYLTNNPITFEVVSCVEIGNISRHTVLIPTTASKQNLIKLNRDLENHINSHGYQLNNLTTNSNYTPHVSLKNSSTGPKRMNAMNAKIKEIQDGRTDKKFFFNLQSSSFSVR